VSLRGATAEEELAGFTSGGSVPAAEGTVDLDADEAPQAGGSATLDRDFHAVRSSGGLRAATMLIDPGLARGPGTCTTG
jgi:hypothetical protein